MMKNSKLLKGLYERMIWYDGGFETFEKYHDVRVPMQVGCLPLAAICDQGLHLTSIFWSNYRAFCPKTAEKLRA